MSENFWIWQGEAVKILVGLALSGNFLKAVVFLTQQSFWTKVLF